MNVSLHYKRRLWITTLENLLIRELKAKGSEDPEVKRLVVKWTTREEEKVTNNFPVAIEFNRKVARIYLTTGYLEAALDKLRDARDQAWHKHRIDLHKEIVAEINKIESD